MIHTSGVETFPLRGITWPVVLLTYAVHGGYVLGLLIQTGINSFSCHELAEPVQK